MFTHTVIYRLLGPVTVIQQCQYQRFSESCQNIMLFTPFLAFHLSWHCKQRVNTGVLIPSTSKNCNSQCVFFSPLGLSTTLVRVCVFFCISASKILLFALFCFVGIAPTKNAAAQKHCNLQYFVAFENHTFISKMCRNSVSFQVSAFKKGDPNSFQRSECFFNHSGDLRYSQG